MLIADTLVEDTLFAPLARLAPTGIVSAPSAAASLFELLDAATRGNFSGPLIRAATADSDDHGDASDTATPVALAVPVDGTIASHGDVADTDTFSFTPPATGFYRVNVDTPLSNLDTVLALRGTGGALLDADDDSGPALDSQLDAYLSAGVTVDLHVSGYNGTETGHYILTISEVPEVRVTGNGQTILDGDSSPTAADGTDFGSAVPGTAPVQRTFTVLNQGAAPLTLGDLTLPSGFSLIEGLSASLAPAASDTFTLALDTTTVGSRTGQLSFTTNDADESLFTFTLAGSVSPLTELLLDNAAADVQDPPSRTYSGNWDPSSLPGAQGPTSLFSNGTGLDTYRWTPSVPLTGLYDVYVRWVEASNRSAQAPYTVVHAGGSSTFLVNQRLSEGASGWYRLGSTPFTFNAGTDGYVQLSDLNGLVSADAVKWVPVTAGP